MKIRVQLVDCDKHMNHKQFSQSEMLATVLVSCDVCSVYGGMCKFQAFWVSSSHLGFFFNILFLQK
jgi:hypothetical protein